MSEHSTACGYIVAGADTLWSIRSSDCMVSTRCASSSAPMPTIVSGNINGAVLIIGEKDANLLKGEAA